VTLEDQVRALREKIAQRQAGLNTYILKGGHTPKYKASLVGQAADFEYFISELDRLLDTSDSL
jgi:hypothetical protein